MRRRDGTELVGVLIGAIGDKATDTDEEALEIGRRKPVTSREHDDQIAMMAACFRDVRFVPIAAICTAANSGVMQGPTCARLAHDHPCIDEAKP